MTLISAPDKSIIPASNYKSSYVSVDKNRKFTLCRGNRSSFCTLAEEPGVMIQQFTSTDRNQKYGPSIKTIVNFNNTVFIHDIPGIYLFIPNELIKLSKCQNQCIAKISVGFQDHRDSNPYTCWHFVDAGIISLDLLDNAKITGVYAPKIKDYNNNNFYIMEKKSLENSIIFISI